MKRNLINTPSFVRAAKKIVKKNPDRAEDFKISLEKLSQDAFEASLKTHKLSGVLSGSWACSAGYDLRIIFKFLKSDGKETILLLTVGTHDEVY
ncbi:MAG TPA: type II toxin-antitoxin system mRNA interferase toxin, RelE/StbE family [Lentisphaeria bacterium]|nr:MAG: plasmid stabilization protein [Lentisphaerae bacterium GWF2_49_21]HBC88644.1 type II toxin-antitoxin system mRNA interferase toxin, RelE/StbE family [Lentisphaeria bacterium]